MKFLLIMLGAVIGNGLGALNIRAVTQERYTLIITMTFLSAFVNNSAIREIARSEWYYALAWALGSVIGITGIVYCDSKYGRKSK